MRWGIAALIVALAALLLRLVAPNLLLVAAAPAFRAGDQLAAGAYDLVAGVSGASGFAAANAKLAQENAALSLENRSLATQNADLKNLFSGVPAKTDGILAGVVARPPEIAYDSLIVAAGSADGVKKDMEAFGPGGVPLGRVTQATTHFARVVLFSSPGMRLSAWMGEAREPLTLLGAGGGAYRATAPRDATVTPGEAVYAPGPGARPIGIVARVDDDPSSPLRLVHVAPAVNPFSVTWVTLQDVGTALPPDAFIAATTTAP